MSAPLPDLWTQAAAGDHAAFEVFYRRHSDRVFRHLLAKVTVRDDARDLCLQVFILAWEPRDKVTYRDTDDILPWLLATANNLSRNHLRSQRREGQALRRVPRDRELDEIHPILNRQVSRDQAAAVLDRLRPRDREIIAMCVMDERSTADAASALGISRQAAYRRLGRALARARHAYNAPFKPLPTSPAGGTDG